MNLPTIALPAVWHIGSPSPSTSTLLPRASVPNWAFEFGMLSVSLDPEAWRSGWAGPSGKIFELCANGRMLRLLDADLTLASYRSDIETAGRREGYIRHGGTGIHATSLLYSCLRLTPNSQLYLKNRPFEDQVLQASLAILASKDPMIDGLWWSDLLGGEMRTERGGIFQHLLSQLNIKVVPNVTIIAAPAAAWNPSNIL
jgi:hypothetical protein